MVTPADAAAVGAPMSEASRAVLAGVLGQAGVRDRFAAKVVRDDAGGADGTTGCHWWIGAITAHGHGRFWLGVSPQGADVAIVAHRFAYALAHGARALDEAPVLAHRCDNPLCQNVEHLRAVSPAVNAAEWAWRRHQVGGPLRDLRGARARALSIRDALRGGMSPQQAVAAADRAGLGALDRDQPALFD